MNKTSLHDTYMEMITARGLELRKADETLGLVEANMKATKLIKKQLEDSLETAILEKRQNLVLIALAAAELTWFNSVFPP